MKGGFYGLKGKQISFGLLALICTSLVVWGWDKTLFLNSLIPSQNVSLQLSPVINEKGAERLEQHHSDSQASKSPPKISPGTEKAEKNVPSTSFTGKDEDIPKEEVKDQEAKHSDAPAEKKPTKISPAEEKETPGAIIIKADSEQVSDGKDSSNVSGNDSSNVSGKDSSNVSGKDGSNVSGKVTSNVSGKDSSNVSGKDSSNVSGKDSSNVSGNDLVDSQTSNNNDSSSREENIMNQASNTSSEACDYARGIWVEDNTRPLYSGFGCKQWLSGMWACRLTQRTDFAYEKLRWHPKDCAMEEFTGPKFLEKMRNKTLAFIGDSLGRQQFQSLMCMVTEGKDRPDVSDVGKEYDLIKHKGAKRPDGWVYRFEKTNTTILFYWSASLSDLEPINSSNPGTGFALHLDRPPAFLRRYIHRFNVIVFNTGHHWNRGKFNGNRWEMHVGGKPNTDKKIANINGAKNLTVHSIVKWADSQIPKYPGLKVFLRSISPRHFFNGDWNTGGTCDSTVLSGPREVLQYESNDLLASSAVKGTKVKLLDITAISQLRDEGHISRYSINAAPGMQDCLHWCMPGVPDTWNEILFAQL